MPRSSTTPLRHLSTGLARPVSRRTALRGLASAGALVGVDALLPSYAHATPLRTPPSTPLAPVYTADGVRVHELEIAETRLRIDGRSATATTINGTVPGPMLRLREGEDAVLRVHNRLEHDDTSIHWHGLILPPDMDGVPGLSFDGIHAGTTFEYRFPVKQAGTYWYHSHSGFQEQLGHYGPLIIDPAEPLPYTYDREFVLVLSDFTFENPYRIMDRLKKQPDYYNFQRRTVGDFFRDVGKDGFMNTVRERLMWGGMRMNPTDISDVTGATYSFLMNGMAPDDNWTGLFQPGERVLLRIINAAAGSYFDVRVPGVPMQVVQVSGQPVEPVETDEFRIALAETYDVIVELPEDRPYTVFAEAMDRSGFAAGTLATAAGQRGEIPARRKRPTLSMMDMGMDHGSMDGMAGMEGMEGMDHSGHDMSAMAAPAAADTTAVDPHAGHVMPPAEPPTPPAADDPHAGHDMSAMAVPMPSAFRAPGTVVEPFAHGPDNHGPGNAMIPDNVQSRLHEAGTGLGEDGWRVLRYTDLKSPTARPDFGPPTREIELHLTGNMERFMWAIDGIPFRDADPIEFTYGERLRLTMVNDTMMNHPMHLHGMWMELENGHGDRSPRIHTVNVKPAEAVSLLINADAPGRWAFHCHVLYHMEVGMFREVRVSERPLADHNAHSAHTRDR